LRVRLIRDWRVRIEGEFTARSGSDVFRFDDGSLLGVNITGGGIATLKEVRQ